MRRIITGPLTRRCPRPQNTLTSGLALNRSLVIGNAAWATPKLRRSLGLQPALARKSPPQHLPDSRDVPQAHKPELLAVPAHLSKAFDELNSFVASHPFWNNTVFQACEAGTLTLADWRLFFEQYFHYSRNFTRYLAGTMFRCDDDGLRAKLTQNLWEESGGIDLEKRHSQIFRNFLRQSLQLKPEAARFTAFTHQFVEQYLQLSCHKDPLFAAAFLSLGTEGIVSPMYKRLVTGMLSAGLKDEELEFFHIHIACDDEHAATLAEIMFSHGHRSDWAAVCKQAADQALKLRGQFFDQLLVACMQMRKGVKPVYAEEHGKIALSATQHVNGSGHSESAHPSGSSFSFGDTSKNINGPQIVAAQLPPGADPVHRNVCGTGQASDFSRERKHPVFPVRLPSIGTSLSIGELDAGLSTNKHRHAYESLIYVLEGSGRFHVEDQAHELQAGDAVYVGPWCWHYHTATGSKRLKYLQASNLPQLLQLKISPLREDPP